MHVESTRTADPNDRPVFDLDGMNVESWPGSYTGGDNGRGCWQVGGAYYNISGIVFRNCRTANGNSPGIRARDPESLTVCDCLFENNNVGFSGNGDVTLEFSELVGNGRVSNPPQHNIYIFGGKFRLPYSYIHDLVGGQTSWSAPMQEYFQNDANAMKFRLRASALDLGAFESSTTGDGDGRYDDPGQPPPTGSGGGGATAPPQRA